MSHSKILLLFLCLAVPVKALSACKAASRKIQAIADADQKDRASWSMFSAEQWARVAQRDLKRRKQIAEMFAEGCFKTAQDYENAALVFQHGDTSDHFYQTYIWASEAVKLGAHTDLAALGIDRYLMDKGYKQLYGSQARLMKDSPRRCECLWPVEPGVTDEDRRRMFAPTLAEKLHWVDQLNAGKSCPPASYCQEDAKPVPKGFLPGVAW